MKLSPLSPLSVSHDSVHSDPVLDTAVTHALLRRVARGDLGETLRLYVPHDAIVFSMLDAQRSGFDQARRTAEESGFPGVLRLAGGNAALFHTQSLAFSWATPVTESANGIRRRFELVSRWIQRSLIRVGVPAQIGAVPREYCPGEYSVNADGKFKIMGVGQRVIRGAAHVGGVILVADSQRARSMLSQVYKDLELDLDPKTVGAVEDAVPGIALEDVKQALVDEINRDRAIKSVSLDEKTYALASELLPWHSPSKNPKGRATALGTKVLSVRP